MPVEVFRIDREKIISRLKQFPYTLAELYSSLKEGWGIAKEVAKHGIFLYRVNNAQDKTLKEWLDRIVKNSRERLQK